MKKYLILGIIGILWGTGVVIRGIITIGNMNPSTPYATGQFAGLIFGAGLIVAGILSVIKWKKTKRA